MHFDDDFSEQALNIKQVKFNWKPNLSHSSYYPSVFIYINLDYSSLTLALNSVMYYTTAFTATYLVFLSLALTFVFISPICVLFFASIVLII